MKTWIVAVVVIVAAVIWHKRRKKTAKPDVRGAYEVRGFGLELETGIRLPERVSGPYSGNTVSFGLSPEQLPEIKDVAFARNCWANFTEMGRAEPVQMHPDFT